jgi:hypothetical protein
MPIEAADYILQWKLDILKLCNSLYLLALLFIVQRATDAGEGVQRGILQRVVIGSDTRRQDPISMRRTTRE